MTGYRVFLLKVPSGIFSREEFEAPSDEAAVVKAQELARAHPYASGYELWERARLVHREGEAFQTA